MTLNKKLLAIYLIAIVACSCDDWLISIYEDSACSEEFTFSLIVPDSTCVTWDNDESFYVESEGTDEWEVWWCYDVECETGSCEEWEVTSSDECEEEGGWEYFEVESYTTSEEDLNWVEYWDDWCMDQEFAWLVETDICEESLYDDFFEVTATSTHVTEEWYSEAGCASAEGLNNYVEPLDSCEEEDGYSWEVGYGLWSQSSDTGSGGGSGTTTTTSAKNLFVGAAGVLALAALF